MTDAMAALFLSVLASLGSAEDEFDVAWSAVSARFEKVLGEEGVVGSSLSFARGGKVLGRCHYGLADRVSGRKVDAETIHHWASITKTLTAVSAMQLVERDLLSLDDPVVKYLPELRSVHNPYGPMRDITLRHLMTHSSGFRGPTFPWGGTEAWHPHEPTSWSQIAAMMPYTKIHFSPGSRFSYSNPGFSMIGRIIELISGDDIEVYIQKNILMPLGMNRSYFDTTPWHLQEHRSHSYTLDGEKLIDHGPDFDTGATHGNGGLNAPVGDMLRWLDFLLGVGDRRNHSFVLKRQTLENMWKPRQSTGNAALAESMGMSFFVIASPTGDQEKRIVGHTGSQRAFRSFIYFHPESGTAAIFAANTTRTGVERPVSSLGRTRTDLIDSVFPLFFK